MRKTLSLILFSLFLIGGQIIFGQTTNQGTIVGTVKDQNESTIPAVTITITNTETGVSRTVVTDDNGNYRLDFLPPGRYRVVAEVAGFKKAELSQVTINVSDITRADVKMEVGQITEQVTVSTDTAGAVNTENSTLGEVINERIIDNMPLNGREFVELSGLVPGVSTGSGKTGSVESKGLAVAVGGSRSSYNSYYVDGADSTDNYFGQLVSSPALDSIKEFRVETSLYSAKYGRSGGGVVSVVTKSGTNRFSGSLYEFHRNKAFDALPYFQTSGRDATPPYLYNLFGGTIGGPIFKNKTFFFFSAEFFRQKKPGQLLEGFSPTALERQGNFTQSINGYTQAPVVLVNPYCNPPDLVEGAPYCVQPTIASKILPAELINPVGVKLMNLIPDANYNDPILNLRVFRSGTFTKDKYLIKVDHNFKDGSTLSGSYNYGDYDNIVPGIVQFADQNAYDYGKTIAIGYTRAITRNLASDTKYSFTWSDNGTNQSMIDKNYAKEFGFWTGTTLKPDVVGFPRVQLYTLGNRFMQLGNQGPNMRNNRTSYLKQDLVWVQGNHTFQFGGDYRGQDYGWLYDISYLGGYYFGFNDGASGQNNNYRVAGHTFANLLVGISTYTTYTYGDSEIARSRRDSVGLYFQDDWKVTPWLTLNLGIRYDFEPAFGSTDGKFATLNLETGKVVYSKDTDPALLAPLLYPYETGGSNRPYRADKLNFAPRFGFAWRVFKDNKTVVRGGYGMVYTSENMYTTGYGSFAAPYSGQFVWQTRASARPAGLRIDRLVPVDQEPYQLPLTIPANPGSLFPTTPDYPTGNVQHWNLGISRDLGAGIVFETSYVGSKGTNLNGLRPIRSYDNTLYNTVRANYANWSTITFRTKGFDSSYHSWQNKISRRFKNGLSFLGAYTWAHALAEASNDFIDDNLEGLDTETNLYVYKVIRTNADFDVRHRFTLSGTYDLPFGKGRQFGNNWNAVTNTLLGGWRLNMINTFQTGQPFSVRGTNGRPPNRVCDGNLPSSQRTADVWFDVNCFVNPPANTNGDAPPNIIYGPDLLTFDFGLHKELRFSETMKLQLRGEVFNAFNRVNLLGPTVNNFVANASGAKITRQRDNRSIQFGIRFLF